jgi:hypothetical protein
MGELSRMPQNSCFICYSRSGLPDFSWHTILEPEKYTKWAQNIPNGSSLFQMIIKYTNIIHSKALEIKPELGFWI